MLRGMLAVALVFPMTLLAGGATAQTGAELARFRAMLVDGVAADCRARCTSAKGAPAVCRDDCKCVSTRISKVLSDRDLGRVVEQASAGVQAGRTARVAGERAMPPFGRKIYGAFKSCSPRWLRDRPW